MAEPSPETPRRALLKSAEVCEIVNVQPYVLRSWEKEFPDLGTSRTVGGPRFYRRADLQRVVRIKQLVFGEGLTLAGARRRLEEERAQPDDQLPFEDEAPAGVSPDARAAVKAVRNGLRAILEMLSSGRSGRGGNGQVEGVAAPAPEATAEPPRPRAVKRRREGRVRK